VEKITGAQFAMLLYSAFDAMASEVHTELARAGHPHLSVSNEFAMRAIDDGADSAADLARALGVTRQAAAKTIVSLENLDYVGRISDDADARRKRLVVTDHGREAVTIGAHAFDAIYQSWLQKAGDDVATQVVDALRALNPRGAALR
jgi:DNA-binding MarR family transcriptional regulator